MILSDTFRILGRNHHILWRFVLYSLICVLVVGGLSLAICSPLISELTRLGFWDKFHDLVANFTFNFNIGDVFYQIYTFLMDFFELIADNLSAVLPFLIVFVVIFTVGCRFTIGLAELPVADYVYSSMASNIHLSFGVCFVKNLKKSVKLQLAKLCVVFPIELLIACSCIGMFLLFSFNLTWLNVMLPLIWFIFVVALMAFKQTLFGLWSPSEIIFEDGIWRSFGRSFASLKGNFCAIFGRFMLISLISVVLNYILVILTASIGLIVMIPVEICVTIVFGLVMTFYLNGLRFYVAEQEIITPKKKENWERVSSLKDII